MNKYYMTNETFENFLEQVNGVQGMFEKEETIKDRYYFNVGNGWLGLIKELMETLIENGWNRTVYQVKEKFGGLRFYIGEGTDKIHKLINEAENKSFEICEVCGEPGELTRHGWLRTVCEKHR